MEAVTFATVVLAGDCVINLEAATSAVAAGNFNTSTTSGGSEANFWSATQNNANNAWYRNLSSGTAGVNRNNNNKYNGRSVRCVRDKLKSVVQGLGLRVQGSGVSI